MSYALNAHERLVVFVCLSLATFMMVLDYSIANVSIPYIAGDLAVSVDLGTYVITAFAVGNAIGLAMTGWLTKRMGQIRLITWSIGLFTFFSWVCGLSFSLEMLIVGRFIQGFVAGPVIPLSQSLLLLQGSDSTRTRDLAIWSTIVITAPVLGPILGGYISDWYQWSWIFYINIPIGIVSMCGIYFVLRRFETAVERVSGDIIGMLLLAVGTSCLQIFLDKGQQWDWFNSSKITCLAWGALVCLTALVIYELAHKRPFLNLKLFAIPSFSLAIVALLISYAIYFGTIVLVPLWLQEYMGYSSEWAGLVVAALGIAPVFLSLVTPKVIRRVGNLKTLLIAFIFFAVACFYTRLFETNVDAWHVAFSRFIFGFGFVFYISPLLGMSVEGIPDEKLASATGIFHFLRSLIGAVGTSCFTTLWMRRTIFHHERLAERVHVIEKKTRASLELLNQAVDKQAAMLAINEVFSLMGYLFVGLIVLLVMWELAMHTGLREKIFLR